ncbi:hypothetical protein FUA26_04230 [Seonamhaeicola algicola]|uniref:Beta-carotene 15,15'-monooxygenase n=1 Tax=Seonamhaeicola algicola TaxID=1719036 RepID=A0A5C7AZT6_9FLAO|nr:DUF6427 family protein [Seonamhaeicola algicola]TXE13009.1 hypothetical protein FUA26_04230 [Seonamhaeicola algicola]
MITSIFSKSKSINFFVVFFVTLLAFFSARFGVANTPVTTVYVFKQLGLLLVVFLSIFMLSFIVGKNSLTKLSNYDILLFSLFLLLIPHSTLNVNILFSNFFVLLGLRRIMSLRSQKNEKQKLFDAAVWIAIASVFYFWAILFFALILVTLALYSNKNIRHWVIPFVAVFTVFAVAVGVSIVLYNSFFNVVNTNWQVSYNFNPYNAVHFIIAITVLLSFGLWSSFFYLQNIKKKKKAYRALFKVVIIAYVIAFLIVFLAPNKTGSEFLFMFAPLTIIITNYLETVKEKWFKELFLGILIVVPLVLLALQFFAKS